MRQRQWTRRYPPLAGALAAVMLAVFVLPSALNVPQSNPTQTLEFAPVPPEDDQPPPPDSGNVARLGLGSSSTAPGHASGGEGPGLTPPPPIPDGIGTVPSTKRCVMHPDGPRQTGDPLSPPCVAHFEGDNGGATYQGVTPDEIRVVLYFECCNGPWSGTSRGSEQDPGSRELFDLDEDRGNDSVWVRFSRAYANHFNERYQLYNRRAHYYVYFGHDPNTPESRVADALDIIERVDPFAVVSMASEGNEDRLLETLASRGVLNFGARMGRPASFFRTYPKLVWGYMPSIEVQAEQFASYVCTRVIPYPVSFGADTDLHGTARRLGLLYTVDERQPGMRAFATLARQHIEACGGEFVAEAAFDTAGYYQRVNDTDASVVAAQNIARFQSEDVTTIIWAQGYEAEHSRAAARAEYRPEWIVAGDGSHDGFAPSQWQERSVWTHAVVVTNQPLTPPLEEQECFRAQRDGMPSIPRSDAGFGCRSTQYQDQRQLFTGLQVAGPKPTPDTIDEGFHAIPAVASTDPTLPACFYHPGDYTCVKDATAMWWDPDTTNDSGTLGVWRMIAGGQRSLAGHWPDGDVIEQKAPDDPINNFAGTYWFCC